MKNDCLVAILAAGSGERFGGGKLDAELGGKALGQYALDAAIAFGAGPPAIIVGNPAPRFASEAARIGQAVLVENLDAASGLASSINCAASYASERGTKGLMLMLADMPLVAPETLQALLAACGDAPSAVTYPDGSPGIPACFPASHCAKLTCLKGSGGAKNYLQSLDNITLVQVDHRQLLDIDTRNDLAELAVQHRL